MQAKVEISPEHPVGARTLIAALEGCGFEAELWKGDTAGG